MTIYDQLLSIRREKGAGFFVLLDPDDHAPEVLAAKACLCRDAGVDALLIGGSRMVNHDFKEAVTAVKSACDLPLIIFPGGHTQLSPDADALLFLSLISGRNPRWLIEEHVQAAPLIHSYELETISTGYMLIASGKTTAVEEVSGTQPLPRDNPGLAADHALAGQYLGLKMIYLEAGSGADAPVPDEIVAAVRRTVHLPLIVGGGIRSPEIAAAKVRAGADFIAVGTALETEAGEEILRQYVKTVHEIGKRRSHTR
jgi:putative glycerol-1-phosphate prenyltransferase